MPEVYDDEKFIVMNLNNNGPHYPLDQPSFILTADHIKSFRMRYAVTNLALAVRAYRDYDKADMLDRMVDTAMRQCPNLLPDAHEYSTGKLPMDEIAAYLRGMFGNAQSDSDFDSDFDSLQCAEDILHIISNMLLERQP